MTQVQQSCAISYSTSPFRFRPILQPYLRIPCQYFAFIPAARHSSLHVTPSTSETHAHLTKQELTREQPNIAVLIRALPPILGRSLDMRDPVALLERDLVVFAGIVAKRSVSTSRKGIAEEGHVLVYGDGPGTQVFLRFGLELSSHSGRRRRRGLQTGQHAISATHTRQTYRRRGRRRRRRRRRGRLGFLLDDLDVVRYTRRQSSARLELSPRVATHLGRGPAWSRRH